MNGKAVRAIQIVAAIFAGIFPWMLAEAQGGGADSLEGQLAAKYKLVKLGTDSSGVAVIEPGTILTVKKGGILSFPTGDMAVMASTVKDGTVHGPNSILMRAMKKDTRFLTIGEKVYPTKIEVNRKDSKVALAIIECDSCNEVQEASFRRAQVVFQFPKGYLDGADGGQVSDLINQTLEIQTGDSGGDQQQGGGDAQGGGGQQTPDPPAPEQQAPVVVSGLVADVSGKTLIVNVGRKAGLKVGDKLEIGRAVRTVKDPATGKVIKTITNKIGEAVVTEIDDDSATVTFTGTTPPKVGDVAKTPSS
jgi:hypothetical protein